MTELPEIPGRPFVLDVRSLGRRVGSMATVHRTAHTAERLGVELVGIPADTDVDLDLRVEAVSEGVLVSGCVSGETVGQCVRCLDPVDDAVNVYLTELFAYPNSETEQTTEEDDVYRLVNDEADLEQAIIDAIATELPLSPLCRPDCPGLCVDCGEKLADLGPNHSHEKIDPRWAALKQLQTEDQTRGTH